MISLRDIKQQPAMSVLRQSEYDTSSRIAGKLYVVANPVSQIVHLDPNRGTATEVTTITAYSQCNIPAHMFPKVDFSGYDLVGWFTDKYSGSQFVPGYTELDPSVSTLYARWKWRGGNRVIIYSRDVAFSDGSHERIIYLDRGKPIGDNLPDSSSFTFDSEALSFDGVFVDGVSVTSGYTPVTDVYAEVRFSRLIRRFRNGSLMTVEYAAGDVRTASCYYNGQWYNNARSISEFAYGRLARKRICYGRDWIGPDGTIYSFADGWCVYLYERIINSERSRYVSAVNIVTGEEVALPESMWTSTHPGEIEYVSNMAEYYFCDEYAGADYESRGMDGGFIWAKKIKYDGVTYVNGPDHRILLFNGHPDVPDQNDVTVIRSSLGEDIVVSDNTLLEFPM